ncbi:stress-activated map kinase interacting protein 1-domain-containing protein [Elsinoe ampelina]|uniref:Stress-activated map kinase interacting protein 1-domain-containing protein n=1 Tax=Elsinoe ampelina TaxID=302913 RepID=A0A6A6GRL1_9PEZI|nr:stress-activated map kinase interacting protein 1-domain-containing protein [Elsinoe ampelina]
MSLLMNEEFAIYQLRSGYLNNFKDGIGERLITLNPAVFNQPAFRAAGWSPDPSEIKRTYSPPIPTAVTSEYFNIPPRSAAPQGQDDEEEGTLLTGHGSNDTIGPTLHARRRRGRKEQQEEDDSSELSDDSDEEDEKRDAQKIKFNKMPVRIRSGSSPARPSKLKDEINEDDVKVMVTSPSRPPEIGGIRRGSLSAVDTIKQRSRRDTATSSEMSSENEDSIVFRRRKLERRPTTQSMLLPDIIQEEDAKRDDSDLEDEDISEASDLSDIDDVADADILLNIGAPLANVDTLDSSPPQPPALIPAAIPASGSPRKRRELPTELPRLPRLPSGRPVSMVQSVSLLSKALKSNTQADENPTAKFAPLYGKGEASPLWIKVLYPGSSEPDSHLEIPTRKAKENGPITVAEFIGLCLWRYNEESKAPPVTGDDLQANKWVLYMVDFGEVEYDFPPLTRTKPITDFTTNNNKPGRLRPGQKPWDEFAIVKANDKQFAENEKATPEFSATTTPRAGSIAQPERSRSDTPTLAVRTNSDAPLPPSFVPNRNPITGPSFALNAMSRKDSTIPLLDAPATNVGTSRHRTGVSKQLSVRFTDPDTFRTTIIDLPTTTDAYIAEVFNKACDAFNLPNKALYVLKVRNTTTVVPEDRTVEALGDNAMLDLQRRRFIGVEHREGAASPSSESPNAPLLLAGMTPTKKGKKGLLSSTARPAYDVGAIGFHQLGPGGKRYHVLRRQQLSFAPSHPKVIALDGEYIHIMPGGNMDLEGQAAPASGKTTSVHLRDVIGCKVARKHPKLVRVLVYREKETKRYEFEAESRAMAAEIVEEIRKGVERFGGGD